MAFLTRFQLLHKNQSGFRPNHSCETAQIGMVCKWLESINKGSLIGAVMIDFKKAFDLVDHSLLLKKLKHYKLSNDTLLWFASNLSKRKQKVSCTPVTRVLCQALEPTALLMHPVLTAFAEDAVAAHSSATDSTWELA